MKYETIFAGTPSADTPVSNTGASNQSLPSLLERLQQSSPTKLPQAANYLNNNNNSMKPVQVNGNSGFNVQSINLAGLQAVTSSGSNIQSIQVSRCFMIDFYFLSSCCLLYNDKEQRTKTKKKKNPIIVRLF